MGFWGPFTALSFALDPTMTNAGEQEWLDERDRNSKSNAYRSFKSK